MHLPLARPCHERRFSIFDSTMSLTTKTTPEVKKRVRLAGGGGAGGEDGDIAVAPTTDEDDDEKKTKKNPKKQRKTREHVEAVVARANAVTDLTALVSLSSSSKVAEPAESARGGEEEDDFVRGYVMASALPPGLRRWVFDVTKRNMEQLYARTWGWSSPEKRRELAHQGARFLVMMSAPSAKPTSAIAETAVTTDAKTTRPEAGSNNDNDLEKTADAVGFVHFRFELEEKEDDDDAGVVPVAYVYELQTEPTAQGRGVGRRLMEAVEAVGAELGEGNKRLRDDREDLSRSFLPLVFYLIFSSHFLRDELSSHLARRVLRVQSYTATM